MQDRLREKPRRKCVLGVQNRTQTETVYGSPIGSLTRQCKEDNDKHKKQVEAQRNSKAAEISLVLEETHPEVLEL